MGEKIGKIIPNHTRTHHIVIYLDLKWALSETRTVACKFASKAYKPLHHPRCPQQQHKMYLFAYQLSRFILVGLPVEEKEKRGLQLLFRAHLGKA